MAIFLRNSLFLHIPKTGGTWVRKTLERIGLCKSIVHRKDFEPGFGYKTIHNVPIYDRRMNGCKNIFCFVRNPLSWYRSYYGYRKTTPWDVRGTVFDLECQAETFQDFIDNIIRAYPDGYYHRLASVFVSHCTFTGKQENLKNDLVSFLNSAGEMFNESIIEDEKINDSETSDLLYRPDQVQKIRQIESVVFETYGYNTEGYL